MKNSTEQITDVKVNRKNQISLSYSMQISINEKSMFCIYKWEM